MLKISLLKVESPSCLWGRVVESPSGETADQYDRLLTHMNFFYHDVTQDLHKLKPETLEEGQVYVVYWSVMKTWCRAVVESVIVDSVSCEARCLLVDHGERLIIPSDRIRVAMKNFLQLPFWVRRFHLARIKPTTLRVSVYEERARLSPSTQWDSSATLYLHNLLQASTQTEAVLLEPESPSTSLELYLTVRNIKICVNDDLVAKKFAYYSSSGLDEVDNFPIMLSSSVLNQTAYTTTNKPTAPPPPAIPSSFDSAVRAVDWPTAPSAPQGHQHELKTAEESSTSSGIQSADDSDVAAAESDSCEDTDSSPTADPTKNPSLFRFLKFLNPGSTNQQATPTVNQHDELKDCRPEEKTAASSTCTGQEDQKEEAGGLCGSSRSVCPADEETRSSSGAETWRTEEDGACRRLLEWLNPERPNADPDPADDTIVPDDSWKSGILVHSALAVEPCTGLDDAPVTDALRWVLRRKQYGTLSPVDRYSWPAVARGCNTLIVSQHAERPLSYLPPLLTHILLSSIFKSTTSSAGPMVVLLCPGWEKVQAVYDLLRELKVAPPFHSVIVLLGVGKDEAKAVRIPKNCLLVVTTPFSFVRLLSCHCFLFLRLYHLVLDEADQLFSLAPDEMATILQHFQKVTSTKERASCPQQLVAVAKRWTSHMEGLLATHMPYPCVVLAVPEEMALYGNVQQNILMTLERTKVSVLLGALDFNPVIGQKTLIIADSAQDVEDVFKAVNIKSAFCLKTHKGLTHQFDFVVQQWRKEIGPGTHVILVTTAECLKCLGIRDATCVVHYSFPSSPKVFGSRLLCMAENFRNLSEREPTGCQPPLTRSVLLFSERNTAHVVGILRYLERTNTPLPPELLAFARDVHVAREDQKTDKPLCRYLKNFGVCRNVSVCQNRHRFLPALDQSLLPASGTIEVIPLYVKTASVFFGRIVQSDGAFQSMESEMTSYYAERKPGAEELLEGGLYAVEQDDVFHRVKILSVPDRGDLLFFSVQVRFIDMGKEENVKSYQILLLPERFHSLPGQAVEIIVCRVKPVHGETDWHPKVTRAISQKIRGAPHRARVVFSLGTTVFVDPLVRVTTVPGMKTVINEYSVQSEILNTGMGTSNPDHLDLLLAVCQETQTSGGSEAAHSDDDRASPEVRSSAEVDVLIEAFRAAEVDQFDDLPSLEPCEPPGPESTVIQSLVSAPPQAAHIQPADPKSADKITSFHPLARWYQTSDLVIVTVKLTNPDSQSCDFHSDRVVYSGRANGRTYRADLRLHGNIAADLCCWEVKSNEPVLRLVKQQQGQWETLLREKNIFVSYDMEHLEEDEASIPNGLHFVANTGDKNWYGSEVDSDGGSESSSESD